MRVQAKAMHLNASAERCSTEAMRDALILDTIKGVPKCRAEPSIEMRVQTKAMHLNASAERCSTEAMHSNFRCKCKCSDPHDFYKLADERI